jgi:hypothetical protein
MEGSAKTSLPYYFNELDSDFKATVFGVRGLYFNTDEEILFYNYSTFSFINLFMVYLTTVSVS